MTARRTPRAARGRPSRELTMDASTWDAIDRRAADLDVARSALLEDYARAALGLAPLQDATVGLLSETVRK